MIPSNLKDSALQYHDWKLSVIPLKAGSKIPAGNTWKQFQYEHISRKTIEYTWNGDNEPNIGILGGAISGNLLIIDIDSYKAEKELMQDSVFREIREKTFVSKSALKHLPHIAVRMQNAVRTGKALNGQIDLKSEGGYVVAPLSEIKDPKQILMPYAWENFAEPLELNPAQNEYMMKRFSLELIPAEHYHCYGLNFNEWEYVTKGNFKIIGKLDRSTADCKVFYKVIRFGKSKDEIREFVSRFYWNGSKFYTYKNGFHDYFERTYQNCLEFIERENRKNESLISEYRKVIYSIPNNTDQKTFAVLLEVAGWKHNGMKEDQFFMSVRTLAEKAGIGEKTASKSLQRLSSLGVIAKEKNGTRFKKTLDDFGEKKALASVFRLNPEIPSNLKISDSYNPELINHDAFRFKGLGAKGLVIYETLLALEGASRAELFKEVKERGVKSLNTLKTKLGTLMETGLVELRDNHKYYAVQNHNSVNSAAQYLGTAGTGERQMKKHKLQRDGFQNYLLRG